MKIIEICLLLVFVTCFISVTNCNMTLIIQSIPTEPCDDVSFHIMTLMQRYFSNQEVITFVTDNIETVKYDVDVYECIITRLGMPILKFFNVWELLSRQPLLEPNFLETPSTTSCYAIVADSYSEMAKDIVTLAEINPTAKYIFIITDGNIVDGETILKMAWNSYQMSRIIVVLPVWDETSYTLEVMLYNPFMFADEKRKKRGKYFEFSINGSNYVDRFGEVLKIMETQYSNLYDYPVRVYMYEVPSFAKAVRNPLNMREIVRFRMLDGEILYLLSQRMNFKSKFIGNIKQNTMAGSVRAVDGGTADIATNSRIIADHGVNNTVFLTPVYLVQLKYIVPKRYSTKVLNVFIYSMFDWDTELIMIAVFIMLVLTWYFLNYMYERFSHESEANTFSRALIIVTSSQYFISIKFTKLLTAHQQVLLGSMLLYGIVVSSNYQSTIVNQLANEVEDRDINTIKQLVESSYDIKYVASLHDSVKMPENISKTSIVYRLYKKQNRLYSNLEDSAKLVAYNKTLGILCSMLVAEQLKSQYLDATNGRPLIHILRETLSEFYNSYVVQKSSPYRIRMNQILRRALEGGIIDYEKGKIARQTELNYLRAIKENRFYLTVDKREKGISIDQVHGLFIVWISLLTVASFVFVIELYMYYSYPKYRKNCRNRKITLKTL